MSSEIVPLEKVDSVRLTLGWNGDVIENLKRIVLRRRMKRTDME